MGKDGPGTSIEVDSTLQNGNDHLGCKQTGEKITLSNWIFQARECQESSADRWIPPIYLHWDFRNFLHSPV